MFRYLFSIFRWKLYRSSAEISDYNVYKIILSGALVALLFGGEEPIVRSVVQKAISFKEKRQAITIAHL